MYQLKTGKQQIVSESLNLHVNSGAGGNVSFLLQFGIRCAGAGTIIKTLQVIAGIFAAEEKKYLLERGIYESMGLCWSKRIEKSGIYMPDYQSSFVYTFNAVCTANFK